MILADISVTRDDLEHCGWEEIIAGCAERTCHTYFSAFAEQASAALAEGHPRRANALHLLEAATILMLSEDNKDPFKPLGQIGGQRTAIATDFTDEQLALFTSFAPSVQDAELQARLADIVWVRQREHHMALLAVKAYLASAPGLVNYRVRGSGAMRRAKA